MQGVCPLCINRSIYGTAGITKPLLPLGNHSEANSQTLHNKTKVKLKAITPNFCTYSGISSTDV
jgi:hypothetical protein